MARQSFREALKRGRVLVSDGATGSNYQVRGLERGLAPEHWLFEPGDRVVQLHREFVDAGANILLTNTFGATALRLRHAGLDGRADEVNRQAVALARQAIDGRDAWVAGSMGPIGELLEPYGNLTFEQAFNAFAGQARALAEAGADLLVIETHFDLNEARAAVQGARSVADLPIVCSFSFDMGAHTMMGLSPEQAGHELSSWDIDMIGVNCGRSLEENLAALRAVRLATTKPLWMKPNAGLPKLTDHDRPVYDITPEAMSSQVASWLGAGAQVVGGCCGTSPEHLRAIALAAHTDMH